MNRNSLTRRLEKLETGHSWWRQKHAAGALTMADVPAMTDQELLDFIGLTEQDPEAYVARFAAEQGKTWVPRRERRRDH